LITNELCILFLAFIFALFTVFTLANKTNLERKKLIHYSSISVPKSPQLLLTPTINFSGDLKVQNFANPRRQTFDLAQINT